MPRAAASAQVNSPVTVPAAVDKPTRRPPRSELRNTSILSGPGAKIRRVAAMANSTSRGLHQTMVSGRARRRGRI